MAIIDKPSDFFNTLLYTGNGSSSHGVTGVGFTPNWTWIKERSQTESHFLFDTVRGNNKYINSNGTGQEYTESGGMAFNSDGFTLGSWNSVNENSQTYASWNWKAGTSFTNDASATGIGTIDSVGSVSTAAGFSVISYTGNGSAGATVAHGLGSTPKMIIVKRRNAAASWKVYHASVGAGYSAPLNTTGIFDEEIYPWNNTSPTSSVFSLGTTPETNGSGATLIAYCFADVQGYSKMGSYIGTGSNSFIYTGFKIGWLLVKVSDGTNGWLVIDVKRSPANPQGKFLYANANSAEGTVTYGEFFSNGFGWKGTNSIAVNQSGKNYVYMAFAENPFVASNFVPATAR